MQGSEPFLSDLGLAPVASGEREASLHLYRRNSCQQERLQQDLQRLQYQQERVLRKANREIIDLNLEQKRRRETLNLPRRRSECLGVQRHPDSNDSYPHVDHRPFSRFKASSHSSIHSSVSRSPSSPSSSTSGSFPRRRASISTPTCLPPLPRATTTTEASSSSPRSIEQLHSSSSTSVATKSSSSIESIQEMHMVSKSKKDFTRLKKASERWRTAAQQIKSVERTGKPPIPTSSFAGSSTGNNHEVHKASKVFDRLSMDTKTSALSSDNFIKLLKNKSRIKTRDAPSKT